MRFFSWILMFIITLFIALILVLTFIQPEFKQLVGAQILTYKTRPLPVYIYVIAAFALGLGLGIFQAMYTFIRTRADLFRKNRRIHELEQALEERPGLQQLEEEPQQAREEEVITDPPASDAQEEPE
jgi:uncharacterized membrane protein YciS (DUF1049 family)